jgi:hypothetical protein
MAITQRRMVMVSLCTVALLAVAGCVGGGTVSSASSPAATSATVASSAASQTYSSKAFVVPLTVTPPPPSFLTCKAVGNGTICHGSRTFTIDPHPRFPLRRR